MISNKFYIYRKTLIMGIALFSMFFGAGNIIFPLQIGSQVGQNIYIAAFGFILSGVGVPFLALVAIAKYQGDYWKFFNHLGKVPAFAIITVLMVVIGPLSALPRTGVVTMGTLSPLLPYKINNLYTFGIIYFGLVFLLSYKESKVVNIIGAIFGPAKIFLFAILIFWGAKSSVDIPLESMGSKEAFTYALNYGYSTMDMFGAFFFCAIVIKSLDNLPTTEKYSRDNILISACVIGGTILAIVYSSFLYLGYIYSSELKILHEEDLIIFISDKILGSYGSVFVSLAVSSACISTAVALARVCTTFLHCEIFKKAIPSNICLFIVTLISYYSSTLGFKKILILLLPFLQVLYPCLIVYCIITIIAQAKFCKTLIML